MDCAPRSRRRARAFCCSIRQSHGHEGMHEMRTYIGKFCTLTNLQVIAIDGGDAKRDLCKKLGAEVFIDYQTTPDVTAEVIKTTGYGAHGMSL